MRWGRGKAIRGGTGSDLVQPLQGESLHHVAFNTDEFDTMVRKFHRAGFEPLLLAKAYVPTYGGTARACHFDTRAEGAPQSQRR